MTESITHSIDQSTNQSNTQSIDTSINPSLKQSLNQSFHYTPTAVTAPTGISAINVGGQTIHSFAGIGLGNGDVDKIILKVMCNKAARERWTKCKGTEM